MSCSNEKRKRVTLLIEDKVNIYDLSYIMAGGTTQESQAMA